MVFGFWSLGVFERDFLIFTGTDISKLKIKNFQKPKTKNQKPLMQNLDKIRTPVFDLSVESPKSFGDVGRLFRRFAPFVFKTFTAGLILLMFQLFLVGAADRIGISPKWSVIGSGLIFAFVFGGLAVWGGVGQKAFARDFRSPENAEPVCKILMIRRKRPEENL